MSDTRDVVRAESASPPLPPTLQETLERGRQSGEDSEQIAELARRWEQLQQRATALSYHPKVLALSAAEPPTSSGGYLPDLITLVGGTGGAWDHSGGIPRALSADEIISFAPEILLLAIPGKDADAAADAAAALTLLPGWYDLPCVREGECYAVDARTFFYYPEPHLAQSAEIIATVLHPEVFTEMLPPYAVRRFPEVWMDPAADRENPDPE